MAKKVAFLLLVGLLSLNKIFAQGGEPAGAVQQLEYFTPEAAWADFISTEPNAFDLVSLLNTPWERWSLEELSRKHLLIGGRLIDALAKVKSPNLKDNFWKIFLSQKYEDYELASVFWYQGHDLYKYQQEALRILLSRDNLSEDTSLSVLQSLSGYHPQAAQQFWLKLGKNSNPTFNYRVFVIKDLGDKIRRDSLSAVLAGLPGLEDYYLRYLLISGDELLGNSEKMMIAGEIFYRLTDSKNTYGYYTPDNLEVLIKSGLEPYKSLAQEITNKNDKKEMLLEMMLRNRS